MSPLVCGARRRRRGRRTACDAGRARRSRPAARRSAASRELDLEAEPVGQVAVVGQGERGRRRRPAASRRTSSSGRAGADAEQRGVLVAGHAGGDRSAGPRRPGARARCRVCQMPGSAASARLTPAGQRRRHPLAGRGRAARRRRCAPTGCAAPRCPAPSAGVGAPRRAAARSRSRRPGGRRLPAGLGDRGRRVPERAERQRLVEGRAGHEPARALRRLSTSPCVAQHLQRPAHGHPARAVPRAEHRLALQGAGRRRGRRGRCARAGRRRWSRNRAPVINLYATSERAGGQRVRTGSCGD